MRLSAEKKIERAKVQLMIKHPFFGYLLSHLKFKKFNSAHPMGTDYEHIYYNPKIIEKYSNEEIESLIIHEILHIVLDHDYRRGSRKRSKWNIACDIEANSVLLKCTNLPLPRGAICLSAFLNSPAEEIYEKITEREYKTIDDHSLWHGKREKQRSLWRERLINALNVARKEGKLPAYFKRIIDELYPKLNWRGILEKYVYSLKTFDYNWLRPSKKMLNYGIYYPSLRVDVLEIAIAVDVSSSITREELSMFFAEIKSILNSFDLFRIHFITCDAEIKSYKIITKKEDLEDIKADVRGGGGTNFTPVFKKLEKEDIKLLIYLTDGYGKHYEKEPHFNVLWVMPRNSRRDVPYGEVIVIE